ncbi:hypothetical protein ACHAWF_005971 [Thalassiosira exigua]
MSGEAAQSAEDLRLEGNAAFASKEWKLASSKYRESIEIDGASKNSAKAYSNLAAALCKLGKLDEAHAAAKSATDVDPDWAKAHWRLGSVSELQKDFLSALASYERAAESDPSDGAYAKAFRRTLDRLGCREEEKGDDKCWRVDLPGTNIVRKCGEDDDDDDDDIFDIPLYVTWGRLRAKSNDLTVKPFPAIVEGDITSEQWIGQGLVYWHKAMRRQLGELAGFGTKEVSRKFDALVRQYRGGGMSKGEFDAAKFEITGCPPADGSEFEGFLTALSHLMGDYLPLENPTGDRSRERRKLVPSPEWLGGFKNQQFIAISMCIYHELVGCRRLLGGDLVMSPGIANIASAFLANTGQDYSEISGGVSPEDAIAFVKKKLAGGNEWEVEGKGLIRKYVAFLYRGTLLSTWMMRMVMGLGRAQKDIKWARRFVTLADEEWKVTENESYRVHGASFRKSFQVNFLCMELQTAQTLRNWDTPRLEELVYEWNLLQEIITIAKKQPMPTGTLSFDAWMFYTTFSRKPLAHALSVFGSSMVQMKSHFDLFMDAMKETGLMDRDRDDNLLSFIGDESDPNGLLNVNSLIAETYKQAALAQLPDDKEAAILWWGYASGLLHAGDYKLGDLRSAINSAVVASQRIDPLFGSGPDQWKGSVYQKEALLVARYYQDESDDFVLPQLMMEERADGKLSAVIDGQLLCMDMGVHYRAQKRKGVDKTRDAYLDVSEVQDEVEKVDG